MNRVLAALSRRTFTTLEPHLCDVTLMDVAHQPDTDQVDFITSGVVAITTAPHEDAVAVAFVGLEGVCGLSEAVGWGPSQFGRQVVIEGRASRIDAGRLRSVMDNATDIRAALHQYARARFLTVAQAVQAACRHPLDRRLAGWILNIHDRVPGDELPVTHELVANLLGVRRPGVTVALHILEGEHLIRSRRGRVIVLDRAGLERRAGDAYGHGPRSYRNLFEDISCRTDQPVRQHDGPAPGLPWKPLYRPFDRKGERQISTAENAPPRRESPLPARQRYR